MSRCARRQARNRKRLSKKVQPSRRAMRRLMAEALESRNLLTVFTPNSVAEASQ